MANDVDRKSEFDDKYEIYQMGWRNFNEQATLDLDFYLKAQHTSEEFERAEEQDRILYTFDKVSSQVDLLHGYEIRNRHILKIGPVGTFDAEEDEACNQHTGVTMSDMSRLGGYDVLSEAFKWGSLITGSNLVERWRDRDGRMQYGRLGYNQFLLDSGLTKPDLSDCQDILTGQWITTDKAKMLVPTEADKIDEIEPLTNSPRWVYQSQPALQNKAQKRLYEQWWHRETEEVSMVQSRQTGEKMPFKEFTDQIAGGDKKVAQAIIDNTLMPNGIPALVKFREMQDKVRLTIFLDDVFLWEGDNPTGLRDFNYTWVHGDWCHECTQSGLKLQGWVRGLRDPQRARNRKINQVIDIIESQLQAVRISRGKHLINPEETFKSGQGVNLFVDDDAPDSLPLEQIFKQMPGSDVPQSIFAAVELVTNAETEANGLNDSIAGTDEKDIPGVLHQYRTGQALIGQEGVFQDFRASKRDLGRKGVRLAQINYDPQTVKEMINQDPVDGFYDEDLMRFDCNPTEGLLTDSQRNIYYQEIKQLMQEFPEKFGNIFTAEMIIKAAPMMFSNQTLQMIKQAEQAQQQAMQKAKQQEDMNIQLQQALTGTQVARAMEDSADAAEARSQIPLNNAKTITEINKNQSEPVIEMLREMVKLEIANNANTARTAS